MYAHSKRGISSGGFLNGQVSRGTDSNSGFKSSLALSHCEGSQRRLVDMRTMSATALIIYGMQRGVEKRARVCVCVYVCTHVEREGECQEKWCHGSTTTIPLVVWGLVPSLSMEEGGCLFCLGTRSPPCSWRGHFRRERIEGGRKGEREGG